jgi:hypothetical protein
MSGRVSEAEKSQRRYLRLAVLELEKVRRVKEKDRSSQRISELDQRLADIATEQALLLAETSPGVAPPPAPSAPGFSIPY